MADGPEERQAELDEQHESELCRIEQDELNDTLRDIMTPDHSLSDLARSLEYCKRVIL